LIKNTKIYDEFIDFIAKGTNSESVIQFQFLESIKEEIENELLLIEHIIRLTKAKAHQYIKSQYKDYELSCK
jgi:hypothetical protein